MIHIPQDIDSKYRFVTLAAQRCDQLMRGAKPRLESRSSKPTTIAQEELLAGLVEIREGEGPWPEDEVPSAVPGLAGEPALAGEAVAAVPQPLAAETAAAGAEAAE